MILRKQEYLSIHNIPRGDIVATEFPVIRSNEFVLILRLWIIDIWFELVLLVNDCDDDVGGCKVLPSSPCIAVW